jgi:glutamine cyclotransferase
MSASKRNIIIFGLLLAISIAAYMFLRPKIDLKKIKYPDVVKSPDAHSKIVIGNPLVITLNEEKLVNVDSIVLSKGEKKIKALIGEYKSDVDISNLPLGNHQVIATVYKDGKSKNIDIPFVIVSDITPTQMMYSKVTTIPHDSKSYTQGLEMSGNILYESGGQYQISSVRKVNPKTGAVIKSVDLPKDVFAEGLTILDGKVYQITWKEGTCFIYDQDLKQLKKTTFRSTNGEGWGLTNDGKSLIVSDGSHRLTYLNPETMAIEKVISVYGGNTEAAYLNELEYVDGYIYANIYTTEQIAKIDASNGKVIAVADMSALKAENQDGEVLNGIAFLPTTKTFLITGKNWRNMYEIKFN